MGYTTNFTGQFNIDKRLDYEHCMFLDSLRGDRGGVGTPYSYCQWVVCGKEDAIGWDGGEKFYDYIPWIKWIVNQYLEPLGYKVNGEVTWFGEDKSDQGKIVITDNVVEVYEVQVLYVKRATMKKVGK